MTKKRRAWFMLYQWRGESDAAWTEEQTTTTDHPVRWIARQLRLPVPAEYMLLFYREIDPDMHDEVKAVLNDD